MDLPENKIYIRKIVNYAKSENMNFLYKIQKND